MLGSFFFLGAQALPAQAAEMRSSVGEEYIFIGVADAGNHTSALSADTAPQALLQRVAAQESPRPADMLQPGSSVWAGAPALLLSRGRPEVLLAENVLAATGDGLAAAAALTDGSLRLFGVRTTCALAMPGGHPAFSLGLSRAGGVLVAWSPGRGEMISFDLNAPGCPSTNLRVPLTGEANLTLSATGAFLAAYDSTGELWTGPRQPVNDRVPGLRKVAQLTGTPAALGFTQGEGVLIAVDTQGHGSAWNPRSGKPLRSFEVPGGPFVRGEIVRDEVLLWTRQGALVRWDMLRNISADMAEAEAEDATDAADAMKTASPKASPGWLELRGTALFFVGGQRGWRAAPLYELPSALAGLQLQHSVRQGCLRLSDVDGQVRYYAAATGNPAPQCFAEDWSSVPLRADGTASIPGLTLRLFTPLPPRGGAGKTGSQINARAVSEQSLLLWTTGPVAGGIPALPALSTQNGALLGSVAVGSASPAPGQPGQSVQFEPVGLSVPLRRGLADHEKPRLLPLD